MRERSSRLFLPRQVREFAVPDRLTDREGQSVNGNGEAALLIVIGKRRFVLFDPFDGGERVASTRDAATGEPLGWRVEYLPQGEVTWHGPSGERLAASQIAWR